MSTYPLIRLKGEKKKSETNNVEERLLQPILVNDEDRKPPELISMKTTVKDEDCEDAHFPVETLFMDKVKDEPVDSDNELEMSDPQPSTSEQREPSSSPSPSPRALCSYCHSIQKEQFMFKFNISNKSDIEELDSAACRLQLSEKIEMQIRCGMHTFHICINHLDHFGEPVAKKFRGSLPIYAINSNNGQSMDVQRNLGVCVLCGVKKSNNDLQYIHSTKIAGLLQVEQNWGTVLTDQALWPIKFCRNHMKKIDDNRERIKPSQEAYLTKLGINVHKQKAMASKKGARPGCVNCTMCGEENERKTQIIQLTGADRALVLETHFGCGSKLTDALKTQPVIFVCRKHIDEYDQLNPEFETESKSVRMRQPNFSGCDYCGTEYDVIPKYESSALKSQVRAEFLDHCLGTTPLLAKKKKFKLCFDHLPKSLLEVIIHGFICVVCGTKKCRDVEVFDSEEKAKAMQHCLPYWSGSLPAFLYTSMVKLAVCRSHLVNYVRRDEPIAACAYCKCMVVSSHLWSVPNMEVAQQLGQEFNLPQMINFFYQRKTEALNVCLMHVKDLIIKKARGICECHVCGRSQPMSQMQIFNNTLQIPSVVKLINEPEPGRLFKIFSELGELAICNSHMKYATSNSVISKPSDFIPLQNEDDDTSD